MLYYNSETRTLFEGLTLMRTSNFVLVLWASIWKWGKGVAQVLHPSTPGSESMTNII